MNADSSTTVQAGWAVPLSDVRVTDEITVAAHEALASGWWSMGPRVEKFEDAFASFAGTRHAIAVSNGTAALHLALLAVGCEAGDEVILPSLNFVAAANTISHTGARPVFCDVVGPHDLNMDPEDVEAAVGPSTRAIVALHYGGFPCKIDAILDIAQRHGLAVIEDAAHAPGSYVNGRMCGSFGRAGCFSFFSNKNLAIGEGGMVVTDDDDLAASVRSLRSHGMTTLTWARHRGHANSYDVVARGFNYRLDEVRAAVGLVQLAGLTEGNRARADIAASYRLGLGQADGVTLPFTDDGPATTLAHHLAVILLENDAARSSVRSQLMERRIQTSMHYPPIHGFSEYARDNGRALPITDDVAARLLTLPLYPHMSVDQVDLVVSSVLEALES